MDKIAEIMAREIEVDYSNIDLDKYKDGDPIIKCPKCGRAVARCKIILDKKMAVPTAMNCICNQEREAERRRIEDLSNRKAAIDKYFGSIMENQKNIIKNCTFENWKFIYGSPEVKEIMEAYCLSFNNMLGANIGLLLLGSVGSGKTYATACILNYLNSHGYAAMMVQIPNLIDQADKYYDDYIRTKSEYYKKMVNADLVIFDDFGIEKKFDTEEVYAIINERYIQQKPFIISTNLTIQDMSKYHDRVTSRILSVCSEIIRFDKIDNRQNIFREKAEFIKGFTKNKRMEGSKY